MGQLPPAPSSFHLTRRGVAVTALFACSLAGVSACDALIGTEDRFFAIDDAAAQPGPGDATTPGVDAGVDAGGGDGDGDGGATTDSAADAPADSGPALSPYAAAVMQDAPVAWWRLDDPVGSTFAVDQLGQHPAAVTGDDVVFGVDGAVGSAVMLSANGYLDVGDYFDLVAGQAFSFEAWVKADWRGYEDVFIKRDGDGNGYVLYLQDGPTLTYEEGYGGASDGFARENADPSTITRFVHLVLTFDPVLGPELYINGVQTDDGNVFPADAGTLVPVPSKLYLGAGMNGTLDEMAIYDKALSFERVGAHYQAGPHDP